MRHQCKAYDAFCLSMQFYFNIGNLNTVYCREFHSPMRASSWESNLRFPHPVLSRCHSDCVLFDHKLQLQNTQMHKLSCCLPFSLGFVKAKKTTSILFSTMKTIMHKTLNHFEWGKVDGRPIFVFGLRSYDLMNDFINRTIPQNPACAFCCRQNHLLSGLFMTYFNSTDFSANHRLRLYSYAKQFAIRGLSIKSTIILTGWFLGVSKVTLPLLSVVTWRNR